MISRLFPSKLLFPFIGLVLMLYSCTGDEKYEPMKVDPRFGAYVSAYTSDVISAASSIRIRLAEDYQGNKDGETLEDLLTFEPALDGKTHWKDDQTLEFIPSENLPSGETFKAYFSLSELVEVPEDLQVMKFAFRTIKQDLSVHLEGLSPYTPEGMKKQYLSGIVRTADLAEEEQLEKVLQAEQNGRKLPVEWIHKKGGTMHEFRVDSIIREEESSLVDLAWDGAAIDVDESGEKEVEVPALGDFIVMDVSVVQQPEQQVVIRFSDPVKTEQELQGLIGVQGLSGLKFSVESNVVRIYPEKRQNGAADVFVNKGVVNVLDYELKESEKVEVMFRDINPQVEFLGDGVIIPASDGVHLPFKAVNLNAVDVKVYRVFENNIPQFFQVNRFSGNRQMSRVARVVHTETIDLQGRGVSPAGSWKTYQLDMEKLIDREPGAIYRVEMGFRKSYSLFACDGEVTSDDDLTSLKDGENEFLSGESHRYRRGYYNYDYDWQERDNPCNEAYYYGARRIIGKNIMASDLGLIAKKGAGDKIRCTVTDLVSTEPKTRVTVEAYDKQQQLIGKGETNRHGQVEFEVDRKPFLLIADKKGQKGYLRVDDASALSMSKFEVAGREVQEGLKGMIYTERGVWRPGDSLYVTFILEDVDNQFSDDQPVTMKLRNPRGQLVKKIVNADPVNGFYDFRTATAHDAPTGNWSALIEAGGASFRRALRVETIKPNRLKIDLDFEADQLTADQVNSGQLESRWLHGATAQGLKAKVEATLYESSTSFEGFKDYIFHDPVRSFSSSHDMIFDGMLDNTGKATITPQFNVGDRAPGKLTASFETRVFERSGNSSVDRFSKTYSPYSTYIGMHLPKGKDWFGALPADSIHAVKVASLDQEGEPVGGRQLKMEIYRIDWRWWWDHSSHRDLSDYISRSYHTPEVTKITQTGSDGKGLMKFKVEDAKWGRYLVRICDEEGEHCAGRVVYMSGHGRRRVGGEGATMLTFKSDKEKYEVGEEATVTIPTGGVGRMLVSVENSRKVLMDQWVEAQDKQTEFSFRVTERMAPNVFVNVTLLQPHEQTANDLPIRMYGVAPIEVYDPATELSPELEMPEELAPEEEVNLTVSEENGQKMTYTVAMVDEGLLDLTNFQTPAPWGYFYGKEALGVRSWDLFDQVMGAFSGKMKNILSVGGGGKITGKEDGEVNRFKPVVKFLGPFELGRNDEAEHTIKMPDYVGSVRTMVVAGNQKGAYGNTEKTTPVKKPLMVLATLPRVAGPSEQVKLPVSVFAMEEKVQNVSLRVESNEFFQLPEGNTKEITFEQPGEKMVTFDLEVIRKLGKGKVKVVATGGGEKASHSVELAVRAPNPKITEVKSGVVDPGQSWEQTFASLGIEGTNETTLEISNIPALNLEKRLDYLVSYPHGCVEQIVSSAFPQLYLSNLMELDAKASADIDRNVNAALKRLKRFQNNDGGMAYWPGSHRASDWGTSYAGHFMIEAEQKGFDLPPGMKKNWLAYQKGAARDASFQDPGELDFSGLAQAYRLYTLALAGEPVIGPMNRLRERGGLSLSANWRLAAAYHLAGRKQMAKQMVSGLSTEMRAYERPGYTYGSRNRDKAMTLETLSLLGERDRALPVMEKVAKSLGSSRWMSTQTTAYSLIAISEFLGEMGPDKAMEFKWALNGSQQDAKKTQLPLSSYEVEEGESQKVRVENTGESILYVRLVQKGIPVEQKVDAEQRNIQMSVNYRDMNGETMNVRQIEQGSDFIAEVHVYNPGVVGNIEDLALTQIFPSGWEIRNIRMSDQLSAKAGDEPEYLDIRDDRVLTYFDLRQGKRKTFRVLLNAAYLGRFYQPMTYCEAMYDREVRARKPGRWVEVVKPGGEQMVN